MSQLFDNKEIKFISTELIKRGYAKNVTDLSAQIGYPQSTLSAVLSGNRKSNINLARLVFKKFPFVNFDYLVEGTGDPFLPEKSTVKTPYLEAQQNDNTVAEDDSPGYEQGKNPSKEEVLQQAMAIIKDLSKRPDEMAKLKEWVERHTWQQGENIRKETTWLKELLELKMAQQADLIARLQKEIDALKKSKV